MANNNTVEKKHFLDNKNAPSGFNLIISADNLPHGIVSEPESYATVEIKDPSLGDWKTAGITEVLANNHSPAFKTVIPIDFYFAQRQEIRVQFFHADDRQNPRPSKDKLLDALVMDLNEFIAKASKSVPLALKSSKKATARVILEPRSTNKDTIKMVIKGRQLEKVSLLSKPEPYLVISRQVVDDQSRTAKFIEVYRTRFEKDTCDPDWPEINVTAEQLCGGDPERTLLLEVRHFKGENDFVVMGSCSTSLNELKAIKMLELTTPKNKKIGKLEIDSIRVQRVFGFNDYLASGLNIAVNFAVDFTGSNGEPVDQDSLHFRGGATPNSYETALSQVASVLLPFDKDQTVGLYGFGGVFDRNAGTEHARKLGEAKDVASLVDIYASTLKSVSLSGPTYFAPMIRLAVQDAKRYNGYSVLVLLTDGKMEDFDKVKDILAREGETCPLSVLLVGVGPANFQPLERLDNEVGGKRDMCDFVSANDFSANPEAFARAILKELPVHIETFMNMNRKIPSDFK